MSPVMRMLCEARTPEEYDAVYEEFLEEIQKEESMNRHGREYNAETVGWDYE